jgi:hypothetical protein
LRGSSLKEQPYSLQLGLAKTGSTAAASVEHGHAWEVEVTAIIIVGWCKINWPGAPVDV